MGASDLVLLAKKIAVGIVITVIPLGILTGGLWVSQKTLKKDALKKMYNQSSATPWRSRMRIDTAVRKSIVNGISLSLFIYALPVALMFLSFSLRGQKPWQSPISATQALLLHRWNEYGVSVFVLLLGVVEFLFGLYDRERWSGNEKLTDIACFAFPLLVLRPFITYFGLKVLPLVLPNLRNTFAWVPFWWGFFIICIADDLTQYWYHRLHHQIPWLWRFHRTHHSAPYMGMSMASRQNVFYTVFFSQIYVTSVLVYLGFGAPAILV